MAGSWRGVTLLLLLVVLCCSLAAASDVDGLSHGLGSRKLLQAATPPAAPTPAPTALPAAPALPPVARAPGPAPVRAPVPAPIPPPAPRTPVRVYLMWFGIGAFCLVLLAVAIVFLYRKFGQRKLRGAQKLPPLPRYH